jgi:4-hydroxy-2-oxoglutarate aldolase
MRDFQGILPPIPTNFTPNGDVDTRAITANVQQWMRTRLAGILALGSNGEAPLLDEDESDRVVAAVRDAVPRDRVLLVGTGREATRATIAATRRAAALGADAVLVRTPSTYKSQMTTDVLVAHYTAVADASPVPVLLYNLPGVTGIVLTPALVATLAAHPNITGIKETSPDLERLGQFTQIPRFAVLCGWAPVVFPALMAGAAGAILAVANVLPNECVELYDHQRHGRIDEARTLQRRLTPLAQLVTATYGIAGLKAALDLAGYQGGPVRTPLLSVSPQGKAQIEAALTQIHGAVLE